MTVFVELCRAKPAWLALSDADRRGFLGQVESLMQRLRESGVEIVSWGVNRANTPRRASYDYFAIFEFPDEAAALRYERTFAHAGWYDYFEQVNVMGDDADFSSVLEQLIRLPTSPAQGG